MAIPPQSPPGEPSRTGSGFDDLVSGANPAPAHGSPSRDVLVALSYGLELVGCGAILVSETGHPQLANRTASAILQKKDGISLARTGLIAERASDTKLLRHLVREAIVSPDAGEPKQSPLIVERRFAHTSLIVRVVPGPELCGWRRTALLKLYDPDVQPSVDERTLITLYGLTRGEAALTAKLIQGKSLDEAAEKLFISEHTARTHLKRVFMKTDTHRQPELVVRVMLSVF